MAHCAAATERPLLNSVKRAHHQEAPPAQAGRHKEVERGRPGAASRAAGAVGGGMRRVGWRAVDRRKGVAAKWSAVAVLWRAVAPRRRMGSSPPQTAAGVVRRRGPPRDFAVERGGLGPKEPGSRDVG